MPSFTRWLWLFAIMTSGALGLAYELIWTRLLALTLGSEYLALWMGLSGYFLGLAAGAWLVFRYTDRLPSIGRWLAASELLAALYAVGVAPLCLPHLGEVIPESWMRSDLQHEPIALIGTLIITSLVLLPACMGIGAILPLAVLHRQRDPSSDRPSTATIYSIHTLGAVLGTLATIHLVLPKFGLEGGSWFFAGLGLFASALFWQHSRVIHHGKINRSVLDIQPQSQGAAFVSQDPDQQLLEEPWLIELVIGCTGILGLGIEVLATIVISQHLQGTIYTFAHMLSVYLAATAFGAWLYTHIPRPMIRRRPARFGLLLLIASAVACATTAISLRQSGDSFSWLAENSIGFAQLSLAEIWTAITIFAVPMTFAGMLYAHWLSLLEHRGIGLAQTYSNLASALSPIILAFLLIPNLGFSDSWFAIAWGYGLVAGTFAWFRRFSKNWQIAWVCIVLITSWWARGPLIEAPLPAGWKTVAQKHSVYGLVTVSEWRPPSSSSKQVLHRLQVGRHFRMGGAISIGERRMGHLPLLLLPTPQDMLFVGVGTGATAGSALNYPIEHLDAIELVPEIIDLLDYFRDVNGNLLHDSRVMLHAADVRRWLTHQNMHWDLAVADLFHPNRDFAGNLFSVEYFQSVRNHLRPDGHFVQWLPLYQLDASNLRSIIASYLKVFPNTHSWLGLYNAQTPVLGLLSKVDDSPFQIDFASLQNQLKDPVYKSLALTDPLDILAGYMLDAIQLQAFSANAVLNRDLHPQITFSTPRASVDRLSGSHRLSELLHFRIPLPASIELKSTDAPARLRKQIAQYGAALELYLQAEIELTQLGLLDRPHSWPNSQLELYLRAYEREPKLVATRYRLRMAAKARPNDSAMIRARMRQR